MEKALLAAIVLWASGCTTLGPIDASPDALQMGILRGELLRQGDRVRIVTMDGVVHQFVVIEVYAQKGLVIGDDEAIAIHEIRTVETRRQGRAGRTMARP
jgi:hypothetical protein